jgi:hypothetical protein
MSNIYQNTLWTALTSGAGTVLPYHDIIVLDGISGGIVVDLPDLDSSNIKFGKVFTFILTNVSAGTAMSFRSSGGTVMGQAFINVVTNGTYRFVCVPDGAGGFQWILDTDFRNSQKTLDILGFNLTAPVTLGFLAVLDFVAIPKCMDNWFLTHVDYRLGAGGSISGTNDIVMMNGGSTMFTTAVSMGLGVAFTEIDCHESVTQWAILRPNITAVTAGAATGLHIAMTFSPY